MKRFVKERWLFLAVAGLWLASEAVFLWQEWRYFQDTAVSHGEPKPTEFFSSTHIHDLLYNAAANWQSELLFGVLLIWLLHKADADV